jgi:hypothetical protein
MMLREFFILIKEVKINIKNKLSKENGVIKTTVENIESKILVL